MSTEENVPHARVDIEAYRRAVHKHNSKILFKQRLRAAIKIASKASVFVLIVVGTYFTTHVLLTNRTSDSHSPSQLIIAMAITGAVFIVGAASVAVALVMTVIRSLKDEVGFDTFFVSKGAQLIGAFLFVSALLITLYLAVFFNA